MKKNPTQIIFYLTTLTLSLLFLVAGNRIASRNIYQPHQAYAPTYYQGIVTAITDRIQDTSDQWFSGHEIIFEARITRGPRRGEVVTARQHISEMFSVNERDIEAGDRIVLIHDSFGDRFFFVNYVRINHIIILAAVFLVLVVIFGRRKGINGIVSLGLSCAAVFFIFIPAILSGRNIYITAVIVCVYAIVSTLLLVIGPNKKALSAMLGCLGGVLLAGLLMYVMDIILGLTGAVSHEATALLHIPTENPINLRAIIFAGVIFGAVGAIMDVAMSIASALWEVREAGGVSDFKTLVKSGITIGQDTLGTMLNTLILAYIGSSLSLILLIVAHTTSYVELFNMEMIIVELLRALIGSFGMLLTIPLTAGICGWFFAVRDDDMGGYSDDDYEERVKARRERRAFMAEKGRRI